MNVTLSLLFHVNNTEQHLHLYVAVKEIFIWLKDLVRKRGNEMSFGGGPSAQRTEFRRRTPSIATGIGAKKSHVYMEIEAMVAGEKINVATVIPEQYTLNKLWQDVRDICFDKPIRHANEVKVDVMLPWETTNMHLKTDSDLQDAFKKLKKMSYSWAMFIIRTELDAAPVLLEKNDNEEAPLDVSQDTELDWFDLAGVDEFALPDLNAKITAGAGCSNSTAVVLEGDKENDNTAGESINAGSNVNVPDRENNMDDLESDVSEDEFKSDYEDEWDAGLDSYESGDDSGPSSDDEDENVQAAACRYEANSGGFEFSPDGGNIVLKVGQLFKTVDEFRNVVKVFAIKNGFRLKRVKNEKSRVTLKCSAPGCTWRIHASPNWNKKHFQIKTHMPEHICERNNENYEATSTWIAATFLHLFKGNTQLPIDLLGSELFRNYGIKCCNQRLYRAKNKALELLGQDHKASFTKLFRYMHAILDSNSSSTVSLEKDWLGGGVNPHFKKFFVFFDACRRGFFEGCRQFVGIDGCHLKGLYKGVLLSAVSIDANYGIYPLAMCVVETENTDSWVYFMEKLYDQICCNDGEGLSFMSDRQKGILNALDRVFPRAMRRYCCRHIYTNFKLKFPGILLRKEFWAACRSGNQVEFNNHMAEINSISPAAHRWLLQIPVTCWAKHCFPTQTKCSHVTNNMTESFNNWIGSVRGMPIVRMLEEIRRKIMILIHKRHELGKTWHDELTPFVRRRLMDARAESRSLSVIFGHNNSFEVMEDVSRRCVVNLGSKHCDCGEWVVSGLPCKHAICCIDAMRYNVNEYVHHLLKKKAFMKTYQHQLHPVPDESKWPLLLHDNLLPPIVTRAAGRPQTKRKREDGERQSFKRSSSVRCSNCDEWGHNVRSCKSVIKGGKHKKFLKKKFHQDQRETGACAGDAAVANDVVSTQNSVHENGQLTQE